MGTTGSVAFQFARIGVIEVKADAISEDALFELVAEAGAEDLIREDDLFIIRTPVAQYGAVQEALREANVETEESSGLQREATTTVSLDSDSARKVAALIEKLEEHQDVQAVYSTMELDDATIAALAE
jgi:transcriptional/translational regulatory protein YebC/TACO1